MAHKLGIDIGGVIFDLAPAMAAGALSDEEFYAMPPIKGSIEAIAKLNDTTFKNSIYLISKYDKDYGPEGMREWLRRQNFWERTGIQERHLYQCEERHEKAPIVRKLGISHFVDDRAEVMSHFADDVPNLYHFQSLLEDRNEWAEKIPHLQFVASWNELLPLLENE